MKKIHTLISVALTATLVFSPFCKQLTEAAQTYNEIDVTFNGSYLRFDTPAILDTESNYSLVPLRPIFEALGVPSSDINWNSETSTVTVKHTNGTTISITVGNSYAYVNGLRHSLAINSINKDGRIYVPLKFIAETLGSTFYWNEESNTAEITLE